MDPEREAERGVVAHADALPAHVERSRGNPLRPVTLFVTKW